VWNEEKEWRIFGTPNTSLKYEPSALTAIHFGFDTEASDIKTVFEYTKHISAVMNMLQPELSSTSSVISKKSTQFGIAARSASQSMKRKRVANNHTLRWQKSFRVLSKRK
jgi:hypothetical protein